MPGELSEKAVATVARHVARLRALVGECDCGGSGWLTVAGEGGAVSFENCQVHNPNPVGCPFLPGVDG
jgi:hypothetical protein